MPVSAPGALVFDVYGTLLDVSSIDERCRDLVPDPARFVALWRTKQLEYSFIRTIVDDYVDFWAITAAALDYTAAHFALELPDDDRRQLLDAWLTLRPFPDVADGLEALAHYPRVILSNGSPAMLEAVLDHSGLRSAFDPVLSADMVRRYKPYMAVYALVPAQLRIPPERVLFFSSNGFDVAGAKRFGFQVCHVNRHDRPLDVLGIVPDAAVASLDEVPAWLAGA